MNFTFLRTACAAAAIGLAGVGAQAADITGAGATFPFPIYAKWAQTYKHETGNSLNYQSIGSGGGIKQIKAKTVTFGATDAPLKPDDLNESGLAQWPMVIGGIVPVVNIDGVADGQLTLDGPTLAKIFLGEIKSWDDAEIARLNPSLKLPSTAIAIVHRSDGSGTTFNFTNYLSKVSPDWKSKVGENTAVEWPAGIGAKGNEGVAANVLQTKDSIGYVEYAYAKQNKIPATKLINAAGATVSPTVPAFRPRRPTQTGPMRLVLPDPDQPAGRGSWPITASTFILMQKQPQDPAAAAEALKFFAWAFANGAQAAEELDYIPLPDSLIALIKQTWVSDIKGPDGKALIN